MTATSHELQEHFDPKIHPCHRKLEQNFLTLLLGPVYLVHNSAKKGLEQIETSQTLRFYLALFCCPTKYIPIYFLNCQFIFRPLGFNGFGLICWQSPFSNSFWRQNSVSPIAAWFFTIIHFLQYIYLSAFGDDHYHWFWPFLSQKRRHWGRNYHFWWTKKQQKEKSWQYF